MLTTLFTKLEDYYPEMVEIRRYLHQHPELSFQEVNTANFIASYYEKLGVEVQRGVGGNGVVATIQGNYPGKTIALRADFDALPILDEKDVPYKSTVPGVMHACGHDGHTASLLVLAKVLHELKDELHGTYIMIHQCLLTQWPNFTQNADLLAGSLSRSPQGADRRQSGLAAGRL